MTVYDGKEIEGRPLFHLAHVGLRVKRMIAFARAESYWSTHDGGNTRAIPETADRSTTRTT